MASRDESFKDFVLDQLQDLDGVDARRMFGGYGLYRDDTFFGILHKGKLYFKVDESTVGKYRRRKMKPFRPNPKQTLDDVRKLRDRIRPAPGNLQREQFDLGKIPFTVP